jgi:hypothetical protein
MQNKIITINVLVGVVSSAGNLMHKVIFDRNCTLLSLLIHATEESILPIHGLAEEECELEGTSSNKSPSCQNNHVMLTIACLM